MIMKQRPLILLVNDDGIYSPGLAALIDAVHNLGDLLIAAPAKQQTSMGRSYPKTKDLGIIQEVELTIDGDCFVAYAISSSPAYAVAYAIKELATRKPDLCISGINYGENLGLTATYSATVGAAMQAADFGIPALAISRPAELHEIQASAYADLDWESAKCAIHYWSEHVLQNGMPFDSPLLNINVPDKPTTPNQYRFTRQGQQDLFIFDTAEKRDFSKPYQLPSRKLKRTTQFPCGTDLHAVCTEQITSVTPMACDLTYVGFFKKTREYSKENEYEHIDLH
jgi:5'-nucleotidase